MKDFVPILTASEKTRLQEFFAKEMHRPIEQRNWRDKTPDGSLNGNPGTITDYRESMKAVFGRK